MPLRRCASDIADRPNRTTRFQAYGFSAPVPSREESDRQPAEFGGCKKLPFFLGGLKDPIRPDKKRPEDQTGNALVYRLTIRVTFARRFGCPFVAKGDRRCPFCVFCRMLIFTQLAISQPLVRYSESGFLNR